MALERGNVNPDVNMAEGEKPLGFNNCCILAYSPRVYNYYASSYNGAWHDTDYIKL